MVAILLAVTMSSGGKKADAEKAQDNSKVSIVKAAIDFDAHKVIQPADIVVEEVKASEAPAGAVTDVASVINMAYSIGATKGDTLYQVYVEQPGIANQIDPGYRAVSLPVDTQGMMSGLIVDGDYVDVVFKARVDIRRVLTIAGVEIEEDGPYKLKNDGKDSGTGDTKTGDGEDTSSGDGLNIESTAGADGVPFQGKPGSEFTVTDAGNNLEPIAKLLVQNVKVIRVVAPGVTYDAQGQEIKAPTDENASQSNLNATGQLILQVTPVQAELLTFIQDQNHSYEVLVRGQDDAEIAKTTGITFSILMTDKTWGMPWPVPVAVPAADDK